MNDQDFSAGRLAELEELYAELPVATASASEALNALALENGQSLLLTKFLFAQSKVRAIQQRIRELEDLR
jgi:hypothetical protein